MLSRGAAERQQQELARIMAATQREFADRVRHARNRYVEEGRRESLDGEVWSALPRDVLRDGRQPGPRGLGIRWLGARCAENVREALGADAAEQHVAVRHGCGASAPVAGWPGIGPSGVRPHLQATVCVAHDRPAARGDRVDVHHRRLQAHAVDLGGVPARQFACVQAHVRGGTAHVESDQPSPPAGPRHGREADDAARRAGEHPVDAAETVPVHQSAVTLHEHELWEVVACREFATECRDVPCEHRRQVGVGDGAVAACHEPDDGRRLVRRHNLREACLQRQRGGPPLVGGVPDAVQEHDRCAAQTARLRGGECLEQTWFVEWLEHFALRVDPLTRLDHARMQKCGQPDCLREDVRPVLVPDSEGVREAARRDEQCRLAAALEQCVGRDRGAEPHGVDGVPVRRVAREHRVDATDCGIPGVQRIL